MPLRAGLPVGLNLSVLLGGNSSGAPGCDKEMAFASDPAAPCSSAMDFYTDPKDGNLQ